MNYRKKLYIYIGITIVAFVVSVILGLYDLFGVCTPFSSYACLKIARFWAEALFPSSISLSLIFLILLFTKEAVFNSWKKFGVWYIPLAALLIFITPSSSGGSFGFSMGIDREGVTMFTSAIFLIVSILIIIVKSWKLRK